MDMNKVLNKAKAGLIGIAMLAQLAVPALAADAPPPIIGEVVARIVTIIQYLGGLFAMVTLAYAGILWMQAGHDPMNKDKAKGMVEKAIIGTVLLIIGPYLAMWIFEGFLPV